MAKLSVDKLDVSGKRVLVRCDFNVPLNDDRTIADDVRITESLPTIKHLLDCGAKVILCSHLGRPKGAVVPELSLAPVAKRLGELLGFDVPLAPDCVGPEVQKMAAGVANGRVLLLENVRFHKEEDEKADKETGKFSDARREFTKNLAGLADLYVNDAFGTAHRDHCSTCGVTEFLRPSAAGFLIAKELEYLQEALDRPKRPLVAILGGAKVGSKIGVIRALLAKVDVLFLGGGMTYTFFKAQELEIGKSLFDEESFATAKELLAEFESAKATVMLPTDVLVTDKFGAGANTKIVDVTAIPADMEGVDIGTDSLKALEAVLDGAATVVWNGPVGVFEIDEFGRGTHAVAKKLASLKGKAVTIIGGGDSAAAIKKYGLTAEMAHISTGGGASMEFLEGKKLPGIEALDEA